MMEFYHNDENNEWFYSIIRIDCVWELECGKFNVWLVSCCCFLFVTDRYRIVFSMRNFSRHFSPQHFFIDSYNVCRLVVCTHMMVNQNATNFFCKHMEISALAMAKWHYENRMKGKKSRVCQQPTISIAVGIFEGLVFVTSYRHRCVVLVNRETSTLR